MSGVRKHLLIVIAIICFALAAFMIVSASGADKRCTESVTATLKEYRLSRDTENNSTSYFPVVTYTVNMKTIEAVANSGSSSRPYEVGSSVEIRYNPDDIYEFVFEGDKSEMHWGIYLIVVGVALIALDILTTLGIIQDTGHYSGHRNSHIYNSEDNSVTFDFKNIAHTAKEAKSFSEKLAAFKNLSKEEREALMKIMQNESNEDK